MIINTLKQPKCKEIKKWGFSQYTENQSIKDFLTFGTQIWYSRLQRYNFYNPSTFLRKIFNII